MANGASPPGSLPSSPLPSSLTARRPASQSSSSSRPSLSLDLSNLPPLLQPSPPSNTLLITDLHDLVLFQPSSLAAIRERITSVAALNSFSPLPSFRRIVCSFHSIDDAIQIRQLLDGDALLGRPVRARIYFGETTPIFDDEEARRPKLLQAPQLDKLFFISPPPSPPHGWVMRHEDPPNKDVHASDLADALARLKTAQSGDPAAAHQGEDPSSPVSSSSETIQQRSRSRSSTVIYNPEQHGGSPNLPAVMVEDTSVHDLSPSSDMSVDLMLGPVEAAPSLQKMPPKTARPPIELMH